MNNKISLFNKLKTKLSMMGLETQASRKLLNQRIDHFQTPSLTQVYGHKYQYIELN